MPAARRNAVSERLFRIHPWIYRKTGGRLLGKLGPSPILLLNHVGRKTGEPRVNAIMYLDLGGSWAVAASWAGEPKHPFWFRNLEARPEVTIQVRDRIVPVTARITEGVERRELWARIVEQDPAFAIYEERTRGVREIPVVVFEPREA